MIKCILENGDEVSFRHVTVAVIVVNEKKEILLVRRADHLTNGGKYSLPGGFVDRDEVIRDAAIREALEETGYKVEPSILLRIADNPDRPQEDRQNIAFSYIAEILGGEITSNSEASEIKWFSLDDLPSKNQFAFDHYEDIKLYLRYLKEKFSLPVFGKI